MAVYSKAIFHCVWRRPVLCLCVWFCLCTPSCVSSTSILWCSHPQHPKLLEIPKLGGRRSSKGLLQCLLKAFFWWHVGQVVKEQRDAQQDFYFYAGMYVRKLNVDSSKAPYLWRKWRECNWAEEKLGCDASHTKTLAILVHGELWSSEGPTEMSWIGTRGQTSHWVQAPHHALRGVWS